jgi:hypothetical protein
MGSHKLDLVKGSRNDIVDYVGILDATATLANGAITGRVCSLNSSGLLVPGLVAVTSLPFWLWAGTDANSSPDTERDRGMPYAGSSRATTWTFKVAGEMSTTEFVAGVYTPGTALSAIQNAATTPAKQGLMQAAISTDTIVGYVSPRGVAVSADGYSTLYFYPAFVKGTTIPNL